MNKIEFMSMSLPSGLKVRFDDNVPIEINVNGILKDNALLEFRDESKISLPISDCKPILRPLSDLVKEIEHCGEKFIPIIKLAMMAKRDTETGIGLMQDFIREEEIIVQCNENTLECEYHGEHWNERLDIEFEFRYCNGFYFQTSEPFTFDIITNQIELILQLIEWHFDIANLIEKCEAIDVNTLDINPYK